MGESQPNGKLVETLNVSMEEDNIELGPREKEVVMELDATSPL